MSMERTIVQKLFESRKLSEASFEAGGSSYKSHFGRYSKDGDSISREEYFGAKEDNPVDTKPEVSEWQGGNPWDDDLFFDNAERLGLETGSEDIIVGEKKLNFDYAILNSPVKFYHATTPDNLDSISDTGLKSQRQGSNGDKHVTAIYLAGSRDSISNWRGKDTKVIEVTVPAGTKVYQDRQSNAVFVREDIPKNLIKVL